MKRQMRKHINHRRNIHLHRITISSIVQHANEQIWTACTLNQTPARLYQTMSPEYLRYLCYCSHQHCLYTDSRASFVVMATTSVSRSVGRQARPLTRSVCWRHHSWWRFLTETATHLQHQQSTVCKVNVSWCDAGWTKWQLTKKNSNAKLLEPEMSSACIFVRCVAPPTL